MDFNRRHTLPLPEKFEEQFFDDGQADFLHHDLHHGHHYMHNESLLEGDMDEDNDVDGLTWEDYYHHMAGYDHGLSVPHHYVDSGNFH